MVLSQLQSELNTADTIAPMLQQGTLNTPWRYHASPQEAFI